MRPLEPCFCNAVWHLRSLSARSSLGDLRSSLQVVPPRRRFWRLLARVVLVCFGVVPSLPWAISRAGSGRTGSSRRALHGPQNLLGIGDWLLLPTACHTQAGTTALQYRSTGCWGSFYSLVRRSFPRPSARARESRCPPGLNRPARFFTAAPRAQPSARRLKSACFGPAFTRRRRCASAAPGPCCLGLGAGDDPP